MIPNDAFGYLVEIFRKSDVPHMVTGSIASTYHGISRATLDVDRWCLLAQRRAPRHPRRRSGRLWSQLGALLPGRPYFPGRKGAAGTRRLGRAGYPLPADFQSNPLGHGSLSAEEEASSPTGHDSHVARSFAVSLNQLSQDNERDQKARQLLAHAAWFAPGEVILRAHLLASLRDGEPLQASKALNRLLGLGLISITEEGLELHRLIASFAQNSLDPSQLQAAETAVAATVWELAKEANKTGRPKQMAPLLAHLRFHTERNAQHESALATGLCTSLAWRRCAAPMISAWPVWDQIIHIQGSQGYYTSALQEKPLYARGAGKRC